MCSVPLKKIPQQSVYSWISPRPSIQLTIASCLKNCLTMVFVAGPWSGSGVTFMKGNNMYTLTLLTLTPMTSHVVYPRVLYLDHFFLSYIQMTYQTLSLKQTVCYMLMIQQSITLPKTPKIYITQ